MDGYIGSNGHSELSNINEGLTLLLLTFITELRYLWYLDLMMIYIEGNRNQAEVSKLPQLMAMSKVRRGRGGA